MFLRVLKAVSTRSPGPPINGKEKPMLKFSAIVLILYLLFGTVACDWAMRGQSTFGEGRQLLLGGGILVALFAIGVWTTIRYNHFLGFSRWQWGALPPAALIAGIVLRFYVL
jgi:hypothetical protein